MRSASVVLILVVVAMASSAPSEKPHYDVSNAEEVNNLWDKFIKDFERVYKDEEDKLAHRTAFVQNLEKINKLNAQSDSATFGINKFADYTEEERKNMFGLRKPEN